MGNADETTERLIDEIFEKKRVCNDERLDGLAIWYRCKKLGYDSGFVRENIDTLDVFRR